MLIFLFYISCYTFLVYISCLYFFLQLHEKFQDEQDNVNVFYYISVRWFNTWNEFVNGNAKSKWMLPKLNGFDAHENVVSLIHAVPAHKKEGDGY